MSTLRCIGCAPNCNQCGTQEGPSCYECDAPYLLELGNCVLECQVKGNRPNKELTQCVDQTMFPVIGPIYSIFSAIILVVVVIVKKFKKETELVTTLIALISCIETVAIWFNLYVALFQEKYKYAAFCLVALIVTYSLNVANYYFVRDKVMDPDASKREKLKPKKVKAILEDILKKEKRAKGRAAREEQIKKKIEHEEKKAKREKT
jgi:hypothetical protein